MPILNPATFLGKINCVARKFPPYWPYIHRSLYFSIKAESIMSQMVDKKEERKTHFAKKLLQWYKMRQRSLPWREVSHPYHVWLSEIILQQTRIAQGLPYYKRFLATYPTVMDLAAASEQEVLRLWQGLGYYVRARNLHKCAQYVVKNFAGVFPRTAGELEKLPGIGPYTAAAIASIAFQEPIAAVDGNVYRVLARIFGIEEDTMSSRGRKCFRKLAQSLLDEKNPGDYNQALMEFGALHCVPRKPFCHDCIFSAVCVAKAKQQQGKLPVKVPKKATKKRFFHYLVFGDHQQIYINQRLGKDIWRGLYDFYLVEAKRLYGFDELKDPLVEAVKASGATVRRWPTLYRHQLTHQTIHAFFFHIEATNNLKEALVKTRLKACSVQEVDKFPFPVLINTFWLTQKGRLKLGLL